MLTLERYFSAEGHTYPVETRTAKITDDKGDVIFEGEVEAPPTWSQNAVNIFASKFLRMVNGKRESSIIAAINRVANQLALWARIDEYLDANNAAVFRDELFYLLYHQMASFNSPVWFNIGVPGARQQASACFILNIEDDMESIMQAARDEAMIFKGGSGAGVNLSKLRGSSEPLSQGGHASGPVSFMRGFDRFAGAIKSGGATRRAALLRCLDADHPDIIEFIECKAKEELKAQALIAAGYDAGFNVPGGAYDACDFQNANNSVRVSDEFLRRVAIDGDWSFINRKDRREIKSVKAKWLLDKIAEAASACGDPGLQFDDTMNRWHTVKNAGRINASNPCQPAWATVLTPEGIRTFADIAVGSIIWSGKQWTKVTRKVATGRKPVFEYRTTAGVFLGTEDHRIVEHGVKTPVKNAASIDTCVGGAEGVDALRPPAVVDGLLIGDGSLIKANGGANEYMVLYIGQNDGDVLADPQLKPWITSEPYDRKSTATLHRARTSMTMLPRTYDRRVPDEYLFGDEAHVRSFLRGLYSANGSVVDGRVTLKATSFRIIADVQLMLSSLGIRSYYTTNKANSVEFNNGIYDCRESYDLNITTDRARFQRFIGFIQKYKNEKLAEVIQHTTPSARGPKTTYNIIERNALGDHEVFDITVEADEHTYWTGGMLVSNCGEFVFLDDTACNLASLRLTKFRVSGTNTRFINNEHFRHAVRTILLAQEVIVDRAEYPTEKIAENSRKFRPLGLGYADLGALLMSHGLTYDSDAGRWLAAEITSTMTALAYEMSSEIAHDRGSFEAYQDNCESMLEVIERHTSIAAERKLDSRFIWVRALARGRQHGYRNAQVTLLAPTGTIGLQMDCDTTGVEPDIALVKTKKLVGGGTMKIVNQSVDMALQELGYPKDEIQRILAQLHGGVPLEDISEVKPYHLAVFDCAIAAKPGGRTISWEGHVKMMGVVQPFLSGAISKTVNMPHNSTVSDILNAYLTAWNLGLKSITVYRDGCKQSQPLNVGKSAPKAEPNVESRVEPKSLIAAASPIVPATTNKPPADRRRMPTERESITHKFNIAGHEGYLTAGKYEDGTLGEIFVRISKEGSTISGLLDAWATAVSIMLQYGVPLDVIVNKFRGAKFEPSGWTGNEVAPLATSITDYIVRWLDSRFGASSSEVVKRVQEAGVALVTQLSTETLHTLSRLTPQEAVVLQQRMGGVNSSMICTNCGNTMTQAGSCYKCDNCGDTSGCS